MDGEVLGEVVGVTGVLAGDVGDVVLLDDGLTVEVDEGVGSVVVELCVLVEDAVLPGFVFTEIGGAVTVDVHGN